MTRKPVTPALRVDTAAAAKRARRLLEGAIAQLDDTLARPGYDADRELRLELAANRAAAAARLLGARS